LARLGLWVKIGARCCAFQFTADADSRVEAALATRPESLLEMVDAAQGLVPAAPLA
jgi:hypothetical protein